MVRLVGIDTQAHPELKAYLEILLLNQNVQLKKYGGNNRGYINAEIFLNGKNINRQLVKAGMVLVDRKTLFNGFDIRSYLKSEQLAKTEKNGLWGAEQPDKPFGEWVKTDGTRLAFVMLMCEK
jgi:endonuclease YncB( thermonuclease family)